MEFERHGQAYVMTTDRQAWVDFILCELQAQFDDKASYVLVTADGLEIKDSAGTRGNPSAILSLCAQQLLYFTFSLLYRCSIIILETMCQEVPCNTRGRTLHSSPDPLWKENKAPWAGILHYQPRRLG